MPPRGYSNLSVREDVRRMLDELRAETGIHDLSDLLVVLVRTYRDYTNAISKIQELLTSIASKTADPPTSATSKATNTVSKVTSSASKEATSTASKATAGAGSVEENPDTATAGGGYEWCYSKSRVRNLQSLLDWVDRRFGLISWWEEDDRYCFETREKPAKATS
jgi:hypothetical protein